MPRFDAFCGGFNQSFSPNITSDLTMNWIPEKNAVPVNGLGDGVTDKNISCSLIRTPGLKTFVTLPKSPVRGVFPGDTRLFAAAGNSFYEIFSNGTYTDRSALAGATTIGNDGNPVLCAFNGTQVVLVSAGQAYCDSGNGPVACQYSDPLSDLLVDPTDPSGRSLTTATGNYFDASDVGRTVQITTGAGFNLGLTQVIQSVNAFGEAIGAAAWGVPGSGQGGGLEFLGGIAYTDLQLIGTPTELHSPSHVFGPSEIGRTLTVTSGTNWTPGTYTIVGLFYDTSGNPTGDAVLDRNAGTVVASAGVGSLSDSMVTATSLAFLDGYFFVTPSPRTKTIQFSGFNMQVEPPASDGRIWNPLDFFTKANFPDNVAALFSDHEELYTFGDLQSTQVWRDTGNADSPFSPDQGATMHYGCQAPFSVVRLGNGVAWLAQDTNRGTRRAFQATGYNPVAVSTPAVEAKWAEYTDISDAVAFSYTGQGHEFWIINFRSANATWVYDATTGWWHQRGWWNTGTSGWDKSRVWVQCVVALGGGPDTYYGGDWQTGQVYIVSRAFKTDDGAQIVRRRMAPHLTKENMRRFYARFEVDCDVLGLQRIFWNRLGNGRDRIWRLDSSQASETGGVTVTLGWSDDRTQSFQTVFTQTLDPSVDVSIANAYLNWVDAGWH